MWARFPANFSGVFMGPKPIIPGSGELFRQTLREQINLKHPLIKLADLIAGLLYLQHAFNLLDDDVVWGWVENPYWQVFTGETYLQIEPPIDPSSLTRWRQRLGEEGIEELLSVTISAGQRSGAVRKNSLETVIVDTVALHFPHPC